MTSMSVRMRMRMGMGLGLLGLGVLLLGSGEVEAQEDRRQHQRGEASESEVAAALRDHGFVVLADGVGKSGRWSSYHGKTFESEAYRELPTFDDRLVRFSNGRTPSPGGEVGRVFDEGALGYRVDGETLIVAVACGINPSDWVKVARFGGVTYGQGDLFLDVESGGEVAHYALLNDMNGGRPVGHNGFWDAAQSFRTGSQTGARVGELVALASEDHIQTSGGLRGHERGSSSPKGLDERVFARGGKALGVGEVRHHSFEARQPLHGGGSLIWWVSEWKVPLAALTVNGSPPARIAFHVGTTCGNDQIGGTVKVRRREIN